MNHNIILYKKYLIYENKVIFGPEFNDKLDDYIDIISKYDELIFSNYTYTEYDGNYDCTMTIKTNNMYCINNRHKNIGSQFIGSKFNQCVTIPQNITHLNFCYYFDQKVIIPQNVIHLTFGNYFNQQVIIPQSVIHLTLGCSFNQQINLPNIKYIKLDCNNINLIENLPNSIEDRKSVV